MYFLQNFTIKDALPLRELELEGFLALMGSLVEKYEYKAYSRGRGRSICLLGRRERRRKRENCREVLKIERERAGGERAVCLKAFRGRKIWEFCFWNSVPLRIEFMWSFHTDDVVSPSCNFFAPNCSAPEFWNIEHRYSIKTMRGGGKGREILSISFFSILFFFLFENTLLYSGWIFHE